MASCVMLNNGVRHCSHKHCFAFLMLLAHRRSAFSCVASCVMLKNSAQQRSPSHCLAFLMLIAHRRSVFSRMASFVMGRRLANFVAGLVFSKRGLIYTVTVALYNSRAQTWIGLPSGISIPLIHPKGMHGGFWCGLILPLLILYFSNIYCFMSVNLVLAYCYTVYKLNPLE